MNKGINSTFLQLQICDVLISRDDSIVGGEAGQGTHWLVKTRVFEVKGKFIVPYLIHEMWPRK